MAKTDSQTSDNKAVPTCPDTREGIHVKYTGDAFTLQFIAEKRATLADDLRRNIKDLSKFKAFG